MISFHYDNLDRYCSWVGFVPQIETFIEHKENCDRRTARHKNAVVAVDSRCSPVDM
jgi:hypothetical protein